MIAWLSGCPKFFEGIDVILDVQGVGYRLTCPVQTLERLQFADHLVSEVFVVSVTREDGTRLFGFSTVEERDWFNLLTMVQGVGGKVAIASLGLLGPDGLHNAVVSQDKAAIRSVPGVGPKVADRILVELKDKVSAHFGPVSAGSNSKPLQLAEGAASGESEAAISSLVQLGYSRQQAASAVKEVGVNEEFTQACQIIRAALLLLAKAA